MSRVYFYLYVVILLLLITRVETAWAEEDKLHIFIRAFVPSHHENYVKGTSIPGVFAIPSPLGDGCFESDNRLFNAEAEASSRVVTEFQLVFSENNVSARRVGGREISRTGVTRKINCVSGALLEQGQALTNNMHVGTPAVGQGQIQIAVDGRASNPLLPSPDLGYSGTFTWNQLDKTLKFVGAVGNFPAYEAWARLNDGPFTNVFKRSPIAGATAASLFDLGLGLQSQRVSDPAVVIRDSLDGDWESLDNRKRFRLRITDGTRVEWIEINEAGAAHTASAFLVDTGVPGESRIERSNDVEVLTFLGFQQSLRNQILQRSPQPSFLDITKQGSVLTGRWNGLLVIKDANANLESLKQPGETAPKTYRFKRLQ